MQDMDDEDSSQQYLRSWKQEGQNNHRSGPGQHGGFVVDGAPWAAGPTATAPNTASNEEFPSFGGTGINATSASAPLWGPRR